MQVPSRERLASVEVASERIVVSVGAWRLIRSHEPPQRASFGCAVERSPAECGEQRIRGGGLEPLRLPFAICGTNQLSRLIDVSPRVGQARGEALTQRLTHRGAKSCHHIVKIG